MDKGRITGKSGIWTLRLAGGATAVLFAVTASAALLDDTRGSAQDRGGHAHASTASAAPAAAAATGGPVGVSPVNAGARLAAGRSWAWVGVPVATVWSKPATARPEDAAAVSGQPDVALWLRSLSYEQKLGLDDLLATQVLMDQEVLVVGQSGGWSHVVVPEQQGRVYPSGIEGWIPSAQVDSHAPPGAPLHVTVTVPVLGVDGMSLSYGTELPARPGGARTTTLLLPDGPATVPDQDVRASNLALSGPAVVAEARRFLGLQYLWAGTSGFGFDCSGLTYTVYRQFGVTLSRDAADQSRSGTPVAFSQLQPGDLVFFAFGPTVDHVGIYAGHGMMIDAPQTGSAIEEVPLDVPGLMRWYAGARRYTGVS